MPDHVDRIVEGWRRERPDLDVAALALLARLFRTAQLADAVLIKREPDPNDRPGNDTTVTVAPTPPCSSGRAFP